MVINYWTSLGLILLTGNIENSSQTLDLRKKEKIGLYCLASTARSHYSTNGGCLERNVENK